MQILTQFGPSDASLEHVPVLDQTPFVVRSGTRLLQLNDEGITKAKISIIKHLADAHDAAAILLQETHADDTSRLKIAGYDLAAHTNSTTHATATFVRSFTSRIYMDSCRDDDLEWTIVKIEGVSLMNVYKPPNTRLQESFIPCLEAPAMYVGGFNSLGVKWGYNSTNSDSQVVENWASRSNACLIFDPKQPDSFPSPRLGTTTNPGLAFVNLDGPLPGRLVLDPFPCSQHHLSLISPINLIQSTQSIPLNR